MKYYLVSYLILDGKNVKENAQVYISLHNFANILDFKQNISTAKKATENVETIVIKSYKQVSMEEYNLANKQIA